MSFSFNFLPPPVNIDSECDVASPPSRSQQQQHLPVHTTNSDNNNKTNQEFTSPRPFHWLTRDTIKTRIKAVFQNKSLNDDTTIVNTIHLSKPTTALTNTPLSSLSVIRQIHEDSVVTRTDSDTTMKHSSKTDLIPGVYEGGLKVWECSFDLCQYLYQHWDDIIVHVDGVKKGHVLELGCGHGLPSCWILKQAIINYHQLDHHHNNNCFVVCSDYNDFVLKDVTIPNMVLNVCDATAATATAPNTTFNMSATDQQLWSEWLVNHVAFGAGDWNTMSSVLLEQQRGKGDFFSTVAAATTHPAIPKDGLFDVILAAETTYSQTAAIETAALIVRHLRPQTGVAYIATKRYYFGVGGGTNCLMDALADHNTNHRRHLHCQVLQVYDNGVGNIRELLLIKDA